MNFEKYNLIVGLLLITVMSTLVACGVWMIFGAKSYRDSKIDSFEECVQAGYPVAESYPERCMVDGKSFTKDIGNELEKIEVIIIENPRPNQIVATPLTVVGTARGNWFFEGSFPIRLYDNNDNLVATGIAEAVGEWMTEEFVPYKAVIEFVSPETSQGYLILAKDNPSGLPENDDELRVPVRF